MFRPLDERFAAQKTQASMPEFFCAACQDSIVKFTDDYSIRNLAVAGKDVDKDAL